MKCSKGFNLCIVNLYFIFTILSGICIFTFNRGLLFFCNLIGASSGYVALGIMQSEQQITPVIAYLLLFWLLVLPVFLLVAYILALTKRYLPLCVFSTVDVAIVIAWVLYAYISGNSYGGNSFLLDAVISSAYTVVLYIIWLSARKQKGQGDGLREP